MSTEINIWEYIERHALFDGDTPLVLLCSGGGDSTALLRLLRPRLNPDHCVVLHVNHLLRGADSDADEAFVRELCAELDLPLEIRRVDVVQVAAAHGGQNLEDAGRTVRYEAAQELLDSAFPEQGGRIRGAYPFKFYQRPLWFVQKDTHRHLDEKSHNTIKWKRKIFMALSDSKKTFESKSAEN
ncbi:MAG: hypothetical protein LBJ07_03615 [Actinomycetes bacterium]|jgi:hypothetical protein|nr:hypothetical protein [Actinomycetes bacterium]